MRGTNWHRAFSVRRVTKVGFTKTNREAENEANEACKMYGIVSPVWKRQQVLQDSNVGNGTAEDRGALKLASAVVLIIYRREEKQTALRVTCRH